MALKKGLDEKNGQYDTLQGQLKTKGGCEMGSALDAACGRVVGVVLGIHVPVEQRRPWNSEGMGVPGAMWDMCCDARSLQVAAADTLGRGVCLS